MKTYEKHKHFKTLKYMWLQMYRFELRNKSHLNSLGPSDAYMRR